MNRIKIAATVFAMLAGAASFSGAQTLPSEQPAAPSGSLPAGHPDISQMVQPSRLPGAAGSAMPAGVNLPAGHPDISQMIANEAKPPSSTQPGASTGTVRVKAVQSTAGGPAVTGDEVSVELFVQGNFVNRVHGKLGDDGIANIGSLPLALRPQPVAKIRHNGVEYQAPGVIMDGNFPYQEISVPVYEATEQAPAWQVRMRHVMVSPFDDGLRVTEMLAIDNPTDKAWLGTAAADNHHETFSLILPADAHEPTLIDGMHECLIRVDGNKLTNLDAIAPGNTQYQLSYHVHVKDGKADLTISAPALVKTLMVMVPENGMTVKAQGMELSQSVDMGTGKTRFYKASDVTAGQVLGVSLSDILPPAKPVAAAAANSTSGNAAQIVAGAGTVVIFISAVVFLFLKSSSPKAAPRGVKRKA